MAAEGEEVEASARRGFCCAIFLHDARLAAMEDGAMQVLAELAALMKTLTAASAAVELVIPLSYFLCMKIISSLNFVWFFCFRCMILA